MLKRLSGLSDRLGVRDTAPERASREQQPGEGSGRRQLSPERGATGRDRERDRARVADRDRDRERERERARDRDSVRRAPAVERLRDSSRDRPCARSRDEAPARSTEPSRDRSRPAGRDISRERSRERVVQGSRERGRDYPPSRTAAGARHEPARASGRDSSCVREGDRGQRPAAKDARSDGESCLPAPIAPSSGQFAVQHSQPAVKPCFHHCWRCTHAWHQRQQLLFPASA